jgi:uncharacterized delta-60 repeat protein
VRRVSRSLTCGLACAVVLTLCAAGSAAVPGDLDTTFDGDGTVVTVLGPSIANLTAAKLQPDGKIVVAGQYEGDFALARYGAGGSLDTSFAGDGTVTTPVGSGGDQAWALMLQPDGKIVAAGLSSNGTDNDFAVVRYGSDGTPDAGFGGGDGIVTTPVGTGADEGYAVALQPDGKIVVAGLSSNGTNNDFAVVRYDDDGTPDTSFGGGDGIVTTPVGTGADDAYAVALQPDGKIVVAGLSSNGTNNDFAVVRYDDEGTPDNSFGGGGDGIVTTPLGTGTDEGYAVVLQPDGKIVVAGVSSNGSDNDFALARYDDDGTPDADFGGGDGIVTTPLGGDDVVLSVALQSNGMIVVGGYKDSVAFPGNAHFALARYRADGTLDDGFGSAGTLVTQVGASISYGWSVALQEDGKIVLAGEAVNSHTTFALARFLGDTAPPANPTLSSPSHSVGVWSNDQTVDASLAGGSDDYTGTDGYSLIWDTAAGTVPDTAKDLGATAITAPSPSLPDGASHYLHLRTVDKAGNWSSPLHFGPFPIDTVAPTRATVGGVPLSRAFQKSGSFRLALAASDGTSGVGSYAVRYRRAPLAGPFGPDVTWKDDLTVSNATFTGAPGSTYCLSARASDRAGNPGAFGPARCTAIPAGSRQLTRKGAWRRGHGFAHYQSSFSVSTRRGSSLAARVTARRLALVATRCPRCGVVEVFLGRRLLKRIDLYSKAKKERQLIRIAAFSALKRGRVAIVVASSGKPVIIEGLGAARR